MRVKILDINVENVTKGKAKYSKTTVAYTYNGEARTQNIMSFANPDVSKKVHDYFGKEAEITVTKNAAGYNEWASIGDVGSAPESPTPTAGTAVRVTGSNYETPAERAQRQVYIIKQSSIGHAIELLGQGTEVEMVLDTAQLFVDYVLGTQEVAE